MSLTSIFGLLHISQRSMFASQMGVQVANHNIANINTPGYTRQELVLTPSRSIATAFGEVGMGVQLDDIRRITDEFLQSAMYTETSEHSEWKQAAGILDRIEILTGLDDTSSLGAAISNFFAAYGQLATNAEDAAVRTIVVNSAITMSDAFNAFASGMDGIEAEINTQIVRQSQEVSDILDEIADLNGKVIAKDTGQVQSNDLRVRRDQLLSRLSELVKFTSGEDQYGAVDIYIAGRNVVHRDSSVDVSSVEEVGRSGVSRVVHVDGQYLAADRIGGSLGALIETRDSELASIREALDALAGTIAAKVNELHERGYSPAGSGMQFFEGTDAGSLRVHSTLVAHPEFVAHSYNNTSGDNSLANDIAALGDLTLSELGDRSILDYYANFVGEVGSLSRTAQSMTETKELTRSQLQTRIEAVSGVSLDEEIANVTKFQTMYEASARMINTVNEMLDTVLTLGVR